MPRQYNTNNMKLFLRIKFRLDELFSRSDQRRGHRHEHFAKDFARKMAKGFEYVRVENEQGEPVYEWKPRKERLLK